MVLVKGLIQAITLLNNRWGLESRSPCSSWAWFCGGTYLHWELLHTQGRRNYAICWELFFFLPVFSLGTLLSIVSSSSQKTYLVVVNFLHPFSSLSPPLSREQTRLRNAPHLSKCKVVMPVQIQDVLQPLKCIISCLWTQFLLGSLKGVGKDVRMLKRTLQQREERPMSAKIVFKTSSFLAQCVGWPTFYVSLCVALLYDSIVTV